MPAFRNPQRHDQGRVSRRPEPQARPRRGRKAAGLAEGAAQFRHRRRPPRRGDRARGTRQGAAGLRLSRRGRRRARGADKTHRWIVDPLDGTTNFLHGIPHFAVSIALERNGAIVAGADLQSGERRTVRRRARQGRVPQRPAHPRRRPAAARRSGRRLRAAALRPRRSGASRATKSPPRSRHYRRLAPLTAPPRSIWPGSPPAASTLIGNAICRRGTWPPACFWCARPAGL